MKKFRSNVCMAVITPEVASGMLAASNYEYQRPLREQHVSMLAEEMKKGNFTTNLISICQTEDGRQFVVNGQHTLNAIVACGIPIELPVETTFIEGDEDIAFVYSTKDAHRKRSQGDIFRAYGLEPKYEMTHTEINAFGTAAGYILNNFRSLSGRAKFSHTDVVEFMDEWATYAKGYLLLLDETGKFKRPFLRVTTFAVALVTFRYCPDRAVDFWKQVAIDDGLHVSDPRKTLHIWFSNTIQGNSLNRSSAKKSVNLGTALRGTVIAWNAYLDGRELSFIRVNNSSLPFSINSTPYVNIHK